MLGIESDGSGGIPSRARRLAGALTQGFFQMLCVQARASVCQIHHLFLAATPLQHHLSPLHRIHAAIIATSRASRSLLAAVEYLF